MKDHKNIERLFQEKFKDFEAIPPQESWNIIASRLNEKKKKKRIIPIWFQLSGIAASFIIIGALIWNFQSNQNTNLPNNSNETVVVGVDNSNSKDKKSNTDSRGSYDPQLLRLFSRFFAFCGLRTLPMMQLALCM